MKLLVVSPYFYPKIGGLENYAYNFCRELKKKYHLKITVVTSNHVSKKDKIEKMNGMTIYRLASLFKISNTPVNPLWIWKIGSIIRKEKPDVINAHTPVPFIADVTALVSGKIPFFVTYHAFSLYKHNLTFMNFFVKAYKSFEHFLFTRADKIIVVSDVIKEAIPAKYKKKVISIYNSISVTDIPRIKNVTKKKNSAIVFIGNLDKTHDWKGLEEILDAVKLYRELTKKDIRLDIIGDGDNRKYYEQKVKDYGITKHVTFYGNKFGMEKNEILKKATLGIIYPKSSNDAFPTVALEYWSHSLPIIISNIIPINKIMKHKKTAYVVQPKNAYALANAIDELTINKKIAKNISMNGYQELQSKYVLENEIKKFYSLMKGVTA